MLSEWNQMWKDAWCKFHSDGGQGLEKITYDDNKVRTVVKSGFGKRWGRKVEGVLDLSSVLLWMVITRVCSHVKGHLGMYLRWVYFVECIFFLNKDNKNPRGRTSGMSKWGVWQILTTKLNNKDKTAKTIL